MSERHTTRSNRMSERDRQMLTAAYTPVVVFAAVVIATAVAITRRNLRAGSR
jgi:hypothetical protein